MGQEYTIDDHHLTQKNLSVLCLPLQIDDKQTERTEERGTSSRVCKIPGVQASVPAGTPRVTGTGAAGLSENYCRQPGMSGARQEPELGEVGAEENIILHRELCPSLCDCLLC